MKEIIDLEKELISAEKPSGMPERIWKKLTPREQDYFLLSRIFSASEKLIRRIIYLYSKRSYQRFRNRFQEKLQKLFKDESLKES